MPDPSSRKARVIGSRLDCLNLRLQGWNRTSIATACMGDADGIERYELRRSNFPPHRTTANEAVQGVKLGTYVTLGRSIRPNTGSPTGREAQGDGVAVVVRERESRPHGEGPQVSDDQSIE